LGRCVSANGPRTVSIAVPSRLGQYSAGGRALPKGFRAGLCHGSRPRIRDGAIEGISENDYPDPDFKLFETKKILEALNINASETAAIGDSPGDRSRFEFAHTSIAINPKGGIETLASHVITDDLSRAIPIVKQLLN
jgi:phosphoserine phosphatase